MQPALVGFRGRSTTNAAVMRFTACMINAALDAFEIVVVLINAGWCRKLAPLDKYSRVPFAIT